MLNGSAVALLLLATPLVAAPLALYVAPNGNDRWSGTLATANPGRSDGPFATLERARDEIRKRKAVQALPQGATVLVRGGDYELARTLDLTAADSGTPAAPVSYRAYPGERVSLFGGRAISGFRPYRGAIVQADLAAQGLKGVNFRQLYQDGRRQTMARYPNADPARPRTGGWAFVDGTPVSMYQKLPEETTREVKVRPPDVRTWAHPEDGEINIYPRHNWNNRLVPLASFDRARNTIQLAKDVGKEIRPLDRYYVRGLLEELDAPGEWYLDPRTAVLYWWPAAPIEGTTVRVPVTEQVIRLNGAQYVTVQGFTVECCEGAAIRLAGAAHCLVAACTVRNVGGRVAFGGAVQIDGGLGNRVTGLDLYDVADWGITVGGGDVRGLVPAGNVVDNCYVHHTGLLSGHGCGIGISGVGNRVAHNLIHDTARCGIFGSGNDHIIEFNRIRHVNTDTEDTGGIYICAGQEGWMRRGFVIRHNFLTDVLGFGRNRDRWACPYYAWGIYLDDAICEATVTGNIVARVMLGGVHCHGGRDHLIENNILVDGVSAQMTWSGSKPPNTLEPDMRKTYANYRDNAVYRQRYPKFAALNPDTDGPMGGNVFRRNIVCYRDPQARLYALNNYLPDRNVCDHNLFWHGGAPLLMGLPGVAPEQQWAEWRRQGSDRHSVVADPRFVDASRDDYRLRPESPALALGFQPIPVDQIGPHADPLRASWPIAQAPGAREHPFGSEDPAPIPYPVTVKQPRGVTWPVPVAPRPVTIDGQVPPTEWPGAPQALAWTPAAAPATGPEPSAWLAHDDQQLLVALRVPLRSRPRLGGQWGQDDAAEVCFRDASSRPGPTFVLRGFAAGQLRSVTDAGAPIQAAERVGAAVRYAAQVSQTEWTAEWAIPLAAAGLAAKAGVRLRFNLGVFRSSPVEWLAWRGCGSNWELDKSDEARLD